MRNTSQVKIDMHCLWDYWINQDFMFFLGSMRNISPQLILKVITQKLIFKLLFKQKDPVIPHNCYYATINYENIFLFPRGGNGRVN